MSAPVSLLQDQVAIVTGASSGIGRAISQMLSDNGCVVAAVGRSKDRLERSTSSIEHTRKMILECDVRDDIAVKLMVEAVESSCGRVDILINAAGVFITGALPEITNEMWTNIWETNVNGTFYPTRAVIPGMLNRQSGIIVVVSSVAAHRAYAGNSAYSASKYAVTGFARALSTEVRRHGVRVINIMPGPVATPIWEGKSTPLDIADMLKPEEVAQATINAMTVSPNQVMEDVLLLPQKGIYS